MKKILNKILISLEENENNHKCSGVPQAAALLNLNNKDEEGDFELIGNVEVNTKVKRDVCDCWDKEWQFKEQDTHAERILIHKHKEIIQKSNKNSLGLIITSYPCDICLKKIIRYKEKIRWIIYLSSNFANQKISRFEEESEKLVGDVDIKFMSFNLYGDPESKLIFEDAIERLNSFQLRYVYDFVKNEFMVIDSAWKECKYEKNELRYFKDHYRIIEALANRKIFYQKGDYVIVKLNLLRNWFNNTKGVPRLKQWRRHEKILNKNNCELS